MSGKAKVLSTTKIDTPGQQRTLWHLANAPNGGFSFGTERVEPFCSIPSHLHEQADELIFVYRGKASCIVGGEPCDIIEGEAICIPAGTLHSITNPIEDPLYLTWTLSPPLEVKQFKAD